VDQAVQTYQRLAALDARGASIAAIGLADLALYEGRVGDAIPVLQQATERDLAAKDMESAAGKLVVLAEAQLLQGQRSQAVTTADRAVAMSRGDVILIPAARVFLGAGQESKTLAIADELAARLGPDPQAYAAVLRGEVQLKRGKIREAITTLEGAQRTANTWLGCVDLGRAYVEAKAFTEAHAQLEMCRERRGEATAVFLDEVPSYHLFPPALYDLGRAREGLNSPDALDAFKEFLAIREKGDVDPLVADARRRLAAH
jgi:tetratricopeptide (TPR) repeat protein